MISALVPEPAQEIAPDVSLEPAHGSVTLEAGFAPAPHVTTVVAGGPAGAWLASPECAGYVSVEPTFDLYYTPAEGVALTISAHSATEDTTLLVNAPDGGWYCNDDFDELNPALVFGAPLEGLYDIWVGSFFGSPEVELTISEIGGTEGGGGGGLFDGGSGSGGDDTGSDGEGSSLFGGGSDEDGGKPRDRR